MGKLTELVTGINGLLPYLETKLTGNWEQWKVRRYTGNISTPTGQPIRINQGATLGAFTGNVFSPASEFGYGGTSIMEHTIIVAFVFTVPDLSLSSQLAAGEFTAALVNTWIEWAGKYMKVDDMTGESISGGKPIEQQGQDKQWYLITTASGRIKYLNDGS